jgi:hypothetical protein
MAASQALGRFVLQHRHVGDEVPTGKLELDDRAVALTAGVATRTDRTEPKPIGCLNQSPMVEQLAEQRNAGHAGHIVLGRLDDHGRNPPEGPRYDHVIDLEQCRGTLHLAGAPCAGC